MEEGPGIQRACSELLEKMRRSQSRPREIARVAKCHKILINRLGRLIQIYL